MVFYSQPPTIVTAICFVGCSKYFLDELISIRQTINNMNFRDIEDKLMAIGDVTEPENMDLILMVQDEIIMSDEAFTEQLIDTFKDMPVWWDQPWYQQSQCLSKRYKNTQENNNAFRTDKICHEESVKIQKRWRKLIKKFSLPDKPDSFARWKVTGQKHPQGVVPRVRFFVTSFLAKGLKRTLDQVFRYFANKHRYAAKGIYSPVEEKVVEICLEHNPDKAVSILSTVLSREPRQIYNKIKKEVIEENLNVKKKAIKWTRQRASKLLQLIMKHTGLPLEELKDKEISNEVWMECAKDMDIINKRYLRDYWQKKLHVQIFATEKIKMKKLKQHILTEFLNSNYKRWHEIQWKELTKKLPDGCTAPFLYYVAYRAVYGNEQTRYRTSPLNHVAEESLQSLSEGHKDLRLKRLCLNEQGILEYRD